MTFTSFSHKQILTILAIHTSLNEAVMLMVGEGENQTTFSVLQNIWMMKYSSNIYR